MGRDDVSLLDDIIMFFCRWRVSNDVMLFVVCCRDDVSSILRQGRHHVRGPDVELGGQSAGFGRVSGVDAMVRGRADDEHLPAVSHEAQEPDGDA